MDQKEKRLDSSEFDAQMKSQNLRTTSQFRLPEQFSPPSFFTYPRPQASESIVIENEAKPIHLREEQFILLAGLF
jgi:hypothetical protein